MGDDGNCQFRALAHGLFGDQDATSDPPFACVEHISSRGGSTSYPLRRV